MYIFNDNLFLFFVQIMMNVEITPITVVSKRHARISKVLSIAVVILDMLVQGLFVKVRRELTYWRNQD